jgi:hypothetical protein
MKLHYLIALGLGGCITMNGCSSVQFSSFATAAKPIADAAILAEASRLGLPPSATPVLIAAKDSLFGAAAQAWASQPAQNGATTPKVGQAIAAKIPVMLTTPQEAALLQRAAESIPVKP